MLNLKTLFGLLAICALTFAGCATTGTSRDQAPTAAADATECASCAKGKSGEAVWCDHCGVGYVEGAKVGCAGCFKSKTEEGATPCEGCAKTTTGDTTDNTDLQATPDLAQAN